MPDFKTFATEADYNAAVETIKSEVKPAVDNSFKKFATEDDFNNVVKSERSKAKNEVLTELGVSSLSDVKDKLTTASTLETDLTAIQAKYGELQENFELTKLGVKDEYRTEALTLAKSKITDDVKLADALKLVVDKMPVMASKITPQKIGGEKTIEESKNQIMTDLSKKYPWLKQ